MKIGIFDSGIGGISLLYELASRLPDASFLYYADSENAPYGEKSADQIVALTERAMKFTFDRGADAIVLACNTATAAAASILRGKYPDRLIFGMEPAVNEAMRGVSAGKILATATPLTLKGEKYHALLDRTGAEERTVSLPLPMLVRYAEGDLFGGALPDCDGAEDYVRESLSCVVDDVSEISAVVLGCTHFIYFTDLFRRLIPDRPIFNGISGTASHVVNILKAARHIADPTDRRAAPSDTHVTTAPTDRRAHPSDVMRRTEFYVSGKSADDKSLKGFQNCLSLLRKI